MAMAMFALATVPLIHAVATSGSIQAWFADDAASGGRLASLRLWWDALSTIGPQYGYYPNATKTYLLVKPNQLTDAQRIFSSTGVQVTSEGRRYLGGAFGSAEFCENCLCGKVSDWEEEIRRLAVFAATQLHASFASLVHGVINKWFYALRVASPSSSNLLKPLEQAISQVLIPALTNQPPVNDATRCLLALPSRLGGMGIVNPETQSSTQHCASQKVTRPLVDLILQQEGDVQEAQSEQHVIKRRLHTSRRKDISAEANTVIAALPSSLQRCALAAQEKECIPCLLQFRWKAMDLSSRRGIFMTRLHCGMAGQCTRYQRLAHVAKPFPSTMPSSVDKGASSLTAATNCVI